MIINRLRPRRDSSLQIMTSPLWTFFSRRPSCRLEKFLVPLMVSSIQSSTFNRSFLQNLLISNRWFSNQQAYYDAITASTQAANSGPFIEFMLSEILETLKSHQGEELNRVHDKVHDKVQDKVHDKYPNITDSAWNVLDYLREHNSASAAMTSEALGMSERMVRKHIATLKAVGLLSRMGSNKNGKWIVDTNS